MDIEELIKKISKMNNCKIEPANQMPILKNGHKLPEDLKKFYELCGGIELFKNSNYKISIMSPQEFKLANPIIVGELCEEDISSEWYIIAKDINGEYITIDLNYDRLGKCYDSFWDRHGVVGECSIIALSFFELLEKLVKSNGEYYYWLEDNYMPYGDAYDIE